MKIVIIILAVLGILGIFAVLCLAFLAGAYSSVSALEQAYDDRAQEKACREWEEAHRKAKEKQNDQISPGTIVKNAEGGKK